MVKEKNCINCKFTGGESPCKNCTQNNQWQPQREVPGFTDMVVQGEQPTEKCNVCEAGNKTDCHPRNIGGCTYQNGYICWKEKVYKIKQPKSDTQEGIETLFNNFKDFLKEKNKRYGDSAINPINIFSKENAISQICNRLDDKISRIKNSTELKKNDVSDMFGYTALLLIENGWTDFDDLLD